jgi:lysozyme
MSIIDELSTQLKGDESVRLKPYRDSVGKLTIGVGRNLDDVGISQGEAEQMLWNDINMVVKMLTVHLPWVTQLSEARLGVLCNMCFNLGLERLQGFPRMLDRLKSGDFEGAATEMENSKWAKQVGARAQRLIVQMRTDQWVFNQ